MRSSFVIDFYELGTIIHIYAGQEGEHKLSFMMSLQGNKKAETDDIKIYLQALPNWRLKWKNFHLKI